jgi:hypothetical protein
MFLTTCYHCGSLPSSEKQPKFPEFLSLFDLEDLTVVRNRNGNYRLQEFIRRFLLHILPKGFQKIRYYGYLSNSQRKKNVARIQKQQKKQRFVSRFAGMGKSEILLELFSDDYHICPRCGADMVKVDFKPRPEAKSNSA